MTGSKTDTVGRPVSVHTVAPASTLREAYITQPYEECSRMARLLAQKLCPPRRDTRSARGTGLLLPAFLLLSLACESGSVGPGEASLLEVL